MSRLARSPGRFRFKTAAIGLTALLSPGFFTAQETKKAADHPPAPPSFSWRAAPKPGFQAGETILYVIKYGIISAGYATLEVRDIEPVGDRQGYHILSRARTNKPMDVIFKVRDKNESWLDVKSLCSLRFHQLIREGLYRREARTNYDHAQGRFTYWRKRKGKEFQEEGGIPAFVQDVLSSLYYVRTLPLEVGKSYELDANSGAKTWPLKVNVKKIEKIRVPAGRFECLHVEPILAGEGIFQHSGRLEVWLTNDERRIPVLLRSRVLVGAFDAEMKEYSGGEEGKGLDEKMWGGPDSDSSNELVE